MEIFDLNDFSGEVIDIRDLSKYNTGHIEGAINIPYDELISYHSRYLNKDDVYCVYCQRGVTSRLCMQILCSFGYKVYSLMGGYDAYTLNKNR